MRTLSLLVPVILGFLWGAPLVAHEMEAGTTAFAWTQGVTRTRWLAGKAGLLLLAAALCGGAVCALVTWWSGPVNAQLANALQLFPFDTEGTVPIGYAVFAMALGITAGALLRRTLPAIAITLGGFIGVRLLFDEVIRQHLLPAVTTLSSMTSTWTPPGQAWVLKSGVVNGAGRPARVPSVHHLPARLPLLAAAGHRGRPLPGHGRRLADGHLRRHPSPGRLLETS
jgi:hypothetical protein